MQDIYLSINEIEKELIDLFIKRYIFHAMKHENMEQNSKMKFQLTKKRILELQQKVSLYENIILEILI